jgi:hypothetical protein
MPYISFIESAHRRNVHENCSSSKKQVSSFKLNSKDYPEISEHYISNASQNPLETRTLQNHKQKQKPIPVFSSKLLTHSSKGNSLGGTSLKNKCRSPIKTHSIRLNLSGNGRYTQKPMSVQQERADGLKPLVKFSEAVCEPREFFKLYDGHKINQHSDEVKSCKKYLSENKASGDSKKNPNLTNSDNSKKGSDKINYSLYSSKSRDNLEIGKKYD